MLMRLLAPVAVLRLVSKQPNSKWPVRGVRFPIVTVPVNAYGFFCHDTLQRNRPELILWQRFTRKGLQPRAGAPTKELNEIGPPNRRQLGIV